MNPMGTNATSNEELKEIENLGREDIEEAPVVPGDVSTIAPWPRQITIRGLVASFLVGTIYSVIVMKLNLTTGLVPNLNVSAALLGFVFIRSWTKILAKANIVSTPFTRQENTVIQTCAVACYSIAVGGGSFSIELLTCVCVNDSVCIELNLYNCRWFWVLPLGFE